ncbi:MAG: Maf family nucleotide pyrophosphatase [Gammaproteobacteria bacterium]|nr:Maf family nucleotide pyrophosphatase [Gammaproteobacteria bacterium]
MSASVPQRDLILASSSIFRRGLLERLQLPFRAVAPEVDEQPMPHELPPALVERLAVAKARAIAQRHPTALVIGSDQVAVQDGRIVGKPADHAAAVRQLREASGRRVVLYTGLALIDAASGRTQNEVVPFATVFRRLRDEEIENYLLKDRPYNCAGSLRSEGLGIALLERFEGDDPTALIGLPLIALRRMLENEGVRIL